MTDPAAQREEILQRQVFIRAANRPFAELTVDDARARADELRAAVGWGPTARIAPVAMAWRELALTMERAGVGTVDQLPAETLAGLAPKLWVAMPGMLS
jgi:hypothetical protein